MTGEAPGSYPGERGSRPWRRTEVEAGALTATDKELACRQNARKGCACGRGPAESKDCGSSPRGGTAGQRMLVSRWAHNPECGGSIPSPLPSGVAQRQGPWPLTT